jgi:predicted metal-dependent phosphoesterase TrpH
MDCSSSPEDIINRCQERGINCLAIADHDSIEGGLKMQNLAPFPVIVAEEVLTPDGEVMGMFLKERVPSGISLEEAISRIKAQDALVCLPHPFDPFRGLKLNDDRLDELAEKIDVVEAFNARSRFTRTLTRAQAFAARYDIPLTAGSDAHTLDEIGNAYVEMPQFDGKAGFLEALRLGQISGQRSSLLVHFGSVWARLKKLL